MGKVFKRGLIALVPLSLTIAIVVWIFKALEDIFRAPIIAILGEKYYFPGLGILVAIILIFAVGAVINTFLVQKISGWMDRVLMRIPFFKTFYNSICDLMSYFQPKAKKEGQVVMVQIGELRLLGMVTREVFDGLPSGMHQDEEVAVFMPMSYQIGGFTVLISRSKLTPIDMSVEQGMRFVLTAGVLTTKSPVEDKKKKKKA